MLKPKPYSPFALCLCLLLCGSATHAATQRHKIALIHSYERNYSDAGRYRDLLVSELEANGIHPEINEFFLNCDELTYDSELARASVFIDRCAEWGADAIAIFNNQATYSFLMCGNRTLRELPVVFSGVYLPDTNLIRQYPNVTGYVDIPDYVSTVRMIERIMGTSRIVVMSGSGMIDGRIWENLARECSRAGIETYDGGVFAHLWSHRIVKDADEEEKDGFYNEQIDTTVVMRLMSESMPLRTIQQTARGSETYFMLTSRTYNSLDAYDFFANPSFAVINEGFGSNGKMLGGYFSTLETQMADMAEGIALRLRGGTPERQMTQCRKAYVLNWEVMQRYGIAAEDLPPEYTVMYVPVSVRYRRYILAGYVLAGAVIASLIAYLTYSLARERKRKKEALHDLKYEHETLKLAIESSTTYAWRIKEGNRFCFDSHFYQSIAHAANGITLEEIVGFVHPEDKERFLRNFESGNRSGMYDGEYRCNFTGPYQWWEFRYSVVNTGAGDAPVVTGLLLNIQKVKEHEAELIRARKLAERAELKQSFLNNMSHEIRTPLNAIVGFSNLLIENPDLTEEEKENFIRLININNELLLKLIDDILELSRIESGSVSFNPEERQVRGLLDTCYQTFSVQVKPVLHFLKDYPEEDARIEVDPIRLQQVVTNLLTNANKFTEKGYIKLGYRIFHEKKEVHIFVEDTGKGISPEEKDMIFSRFYKHDEFAQGTGLGLAICQTITERMGARIVIDSEPGKGSRFTIVLPLA